MMGLRQDALPWLRGLVDRYETAPRERPSPAEDVVRWPASAWDLGTLIAVLPPEAPFSVLNLNWTLGLTGTCFDRAWAVGQAARDVVDLQLCLEGGVTYKGQTSAARDVAVTDGGAALAIGDRLAVSGSFPDYRIVYRQPEEGFELEARFSAWPGIHWWAHAGGIYRHYTRFGDCALSWSLRGEQGGCDVPALLEHAFGGTLLPLRVAPRVFRYEVLGLAGGTTTSLWVDAPLGLEVAHVAVQRRRGEATEAGRYRCEVLEWETHVNHAGDPRRLPRRWLGVQDYRGGTFRYEAQRSSPPRAVIGDGFIHAFAWRGEGAGLTGEGTGYVEQMGRP